MTFTTLGIQRSLELAGAGSMHSSFPALPQSKTQAGTAPSWLCHYFSSSTLYLYVNSRFKTSLKISDFTFNSNDKDFCCKRTKNLC